MNEKKALPIGFSNLKDLLTSDRLYVDKTLQLYEVITRAPKYSLLTRPRRFGKSLILSTLEEIFRGNKELFKNLWIGMHADYEWRRYPVIRLDFSSMDTSCDRLLAKRLEESIVDIADGYGIDVRARVDAASKIEFLIKNVFIQGPVVILIDEYDYPLTAQIGRPDQMEANASVMRAFYTALKSLNEYIHFMFITGISKYPQESMFSGLNNVKDISFKPEYAGLTGYTDEELRTNFGLYIQEAADRQKRTPAEVISTMQDWYNGYRFSSDSLAVYNPFSILNYFYDKVLNNYWFLSGTPTFLVDILKTQKYTENEFNNVFSVPSSLVVLNQSRPSLDVLLYQTGYVTIKSFVPHSNAYYLHYPNYEVRTSMNENLLSLMMDVELNAVNSLAVLLRHGLRIHDIALYMNAIKALMANIPYEHHIKKESYYHSLLQVICNLLELDMQSEVHVSNGRIDMVITVADAVFIFELKCNQPVDAALRQIHERQYYQKFLLSGRSLFLVGVAFNFVSNKLVIEWVSEELD
jgi:hypothetical protein